MSDEEREDLDDARADEALTEMLSDLFAKAMVEAMRCQDLGRRRGDCGFLGTHPTGVPRNDTLESRRPRALSFRGASSRRPRALSFRGASPRRATRNPPAPARRLRIPRDPSNRSPSE